MVGRQADSAFLRLYLLRSVVQAAVFARFFAPKMVGQNTVTVYTGIVRHPYMVDAAGGEVLRLETVERSRRSETEFGYLVGILQESAVGEDAVDFVVLRYIEIAGKNDRRILARTSRRCVPRRVSHSHGARRCRYGPCGD